jgi:hypothetical protein
MGAPIALGEIFNSFQGFWLPMVEIQAKSTAFITIPVIQVG